MLLTSTLMSRAVQLDVLTATGLEVSHGPYLLPPATVQQAVAVLEVAPVLLAARRGSEEAQDAWAALQEQLVAWAQPCPDLARLIESDTLDQQDVAAVFARHIRVGAERTQAYSQATTGKRKETGKRRPRGWASVVADYRATYGAPIQEVLAEPWPLFLAQFDDLDRIEAVRSGHMARAIGAALDSKASQDLVKRMRGHVPEQEAEEQEKNLADLQQLWQAQVQQNPQA